MGRTAHMPHLECHMNDRTLIRIKIFNQALATVIVTTKILADITKHKNHDGHSQRCDCLANCVRCAYEGVVAPVKAAWKTAE